MMRLQGHQTIGETIDLEPGSYVVGRNEASDLVVADDAVSDTHARINVSKEGASIEDLGSTNGTYINGSLAQPNTTYPLQSGDTVAFGDPQGALEVQFVSSENEEGDGEPDRVSDQAATPVYRVGRDGSNEIVIDSPVVSSVHLLVWRAVDGAWYARDDDSTNGTHLESLEYPVNQFELKRGQRILLGNYAIRSNDIIDTLSTETTTAAGGVSLQGESLLIGRDSDCDFPIDHTSVSWHHARLRRDGHGYVIEDLGSTNGTYLNGKLLTGPAAVSADDELLIGTHRYIVGEDREGRPKLTRASIMDGLSLEARNVNFEVGDGLKLIDDVSLTVHPGELVGLMGLSGAGKTTLLKALNGYKRPGAGSSYINGVDIYKNYDLFKAHIGYLPQDDICHRELTVYEALSYYARLRLPSDVKGDELHQRIMSTLEKLGLAGVENTIIGSPDTETGISGGQRKRVNFAMELLADPQIIFLDEPTSGLSAVDAKMVMELLRKLADEGKTIIITIHQPSFDNYRIMDNQIILSYGKLAFYGPTYPDSIQFFNPDRPDAEVLNNPDNALIGLHRGEVQAGEADLNPRTDRNRKGKYWQERYRESWHHEEFVVKRAGQEKSLSGGASSDKSQIRQLGVLASRYFQVKLKDRINTSILLAQAPLIGLMIGVLFSEEDYTGSATTPGMATTLLFVFAISAVWFGTINACREIVSERAVYERERMVGTGIVAYVLSKFFVLTILCALQAVLLVGVAIAVTPFSLNITEILHWVLLLVFLAALSGLSVGLLVSTLCKSEAQALGLVPIVVIPMFIFGGGLMGLDDMRENPNPAAYAIAQIMPTRWALEEMTRLYVDANEPREFCEDKVGAKEEWPDPEDAPDPDDVAVPDPDKASNRRERMQLMEKRAEAVDKRSDRKRRRSELERERAEYERRYETCMDQRSLMERDYGEAKTRSGVVYTALALLIVLPLGGVVGMLRARDNA